MQKHHQPQTIDKSVGRDTAGQISDELTELFGAPISVYTRAQAINDGFLVDLMQDEMTEVARSHYKYPIACTSAVFEVMRKAVENPRYCNSYAGVLHDMLWMSRTGRRLSESTVLFQVIIVGAGRCRYHQFKLIVGPGDRAEPVITIMMPNED